MSDPGDEDSTSFIIGESPSTFWEGCCTRKRCAQYLVGSIVATALFLLIAFLDFISLLSETACEPSKHNGLGCGPNFDLRVVKGFGTKGYNQVRVTMITSNNTKFDEASALLESLGVKAWSQQFRYKWTENQMHSAMMEIDASAEHTVCSEDGICRKDISRFLPPGAQAPWGDSWDEGVTLGHPSLTHGWAPDAGHAVVRLPKQGAGVAGVLIADPCVNSAHGRVWVPCSYGESLNTIERIPALLNAFVCDNDTDYWGMLGDNFYDRHGEITTDVMQRISLKAKSKIFYAVPGNHDFWIYGTPFLGSTSDQCGHAFMQYYAQDSKAAEHATGGESPFNYSVDPDANNLFRWGCEMPHYSNLFWYNQVGNVGLIGQSGAVSVEESEGVVKEACVWLSKQFDANGNNTIKLALLVGHWDIDGMGAKESMDMPGWYDLVKTYPGCKEFNDRGLLRWVTGHTHCNTKHPHDSNRGYRVAGMGMSGTEVEGCSTFGVPVLDTTENRVRWWYFDTSTDTKYEEVITCTRNNGWRGCTENATLWLNCSFDGDECLELETTTTEAPTVQRV